MRLQTVTILLLTLAGFALRLHYLANTHPFFDEYTTVLAARQILQYGWPLLPSGLFYEHGLLSTYLIAPFTALFINAPLAQWQPAHWGLMPARWPSVLIGTATIPLIYAVARRTNLETGMALLAAGLFALSQEGMVWGGRARMYALATLLVLLTVYLACRGAAHPAPAKYRWLALAMLLATLLTQFGAMMLVPALVIAMPGIGWASHQHATRNTQHTTPIWFLRPAILLEGAALTAVIGLAILVKRLGRPIGAGALPATGSGQTVIELINTITYQTTFYFTWPDTEKFLARQFGVPHHFWLTLAAIAGAVIGLMYWNTQRRRQTTQLPFNNYQYFISFLWLTFGLIILEMITLLEPFRRNPRYIVMYLPLFYLIAAHAIFNFRFLPRLFSRHPSPIPHPPSHIPHPPSHIPPPTSHIQTIAAIMLIALFTAIGYKDLRIALITPEPAYDQAFKQVYADWQPGDILLTMNTPAAALYFSYADGFTVQGHNAATQFLLNANTAPIDRWLGAPWIGNTIDFNTILNKNDRTWFIIDTIRLNSKDPVYFNGNWQAVLNTQMEQIWANDNAVVYRTRPNRTPLPSQPNTLTSAILGDAIQLLGYTRNQLDMNNEQLSIIFFWDASAPISVNYTTFLHLRNSRGETVAQRDSQPLEGAYPTNRWQPGETIIDPITLSLPADLPAGVYTLYTGMYQLDTLERLPVANDATGENAILLGEITLP